MGAVKCPHVFQIKKGKYCKKYNKINELALSFDFKKYNEINGLE